MYICGFYRIKTEMGLSFFYIVFLRWNTASYSLAVKTQSPKNYPEWSPHNLMVTLDGKLLSIGLTENKKNGLTR